MNRGFIVLFIKAGDDVSQPETHQLMASIGEDEKDVEEDFVKIFGDRRQLITVISLEQIEAHRNMILNLASEKNIKLDRLDIN